MQSDVWPMRVCGPAERRKIPAIGTDSSVTRHSSHNEQRQHRLAAVVRMWDRWDTGMKAAVTRQCNIKSEDGDYPDWLDNDAYTSGSKVHPACPQICGKCVCACVQLYMMNF